MERIQRAAAALGIGVPRLPVRQVRYILILVLAATLVPAGSTLAATLTSASVSLSDPQPGQTGVSYTLSASSVTNSGIQCIKAVFATTASGDTAPTGWSGASGSVTASSSTLVNSSGSGWSLATSDGIGSSGQKNIWDYTHSGAVTPSTLSGASFVMAGITNSTIADTAYYLQFSTYDNTDCVSSPVDNVTIAFINTNGSTLSMTVDPTLSFSVNSMGASTSCDGATTTAASTATTIPFGTVTSASNGVVCQDLAASTNATHGYTIYLRYTGKPTSGANTLADLGGGTPVPNSAPTAFTAAGTESYGYSTDDSTLGTGTTDRFTNYDSLGHQGWAAASTSNAEIGYESAGVTATHYHIAHQVGVATTSYPGTYSTTIIYTCTPVY